LEDFSIQLGQWFEQNAGMSLALLTGFVGVVTFYVIYLHVRLSRISASFRSLLHDVDGQNLEELLIAQGIQLRETLQELARVRQEHGEIHAELRERLLCPAVARYSAFDDTGSDQSFSLALVDGHGNGAVITALHGRDEGRTYAKPLINGQSRYVLTDEEKQVVAEALREIALSKEDLASDERKRSK